MGTPSRWISILAMSERTPDGTGRQRIVRVRGSRRAILTPAPGTHPEPDARDRTASEAADGGKGPNDARLRQDVPPHY